MARPSASRVIALYRGLSPAARVGVWAALALELALIVAAQRDIHRRPANRIRGPKALWRVVATQNVVGPAAYYAFGRKAGR